MTDSTRRRGSRGKWWHLLLIAPYVALLGVPFYASGGPPLAGIPFFYWYQFLWVLLGAAITAVVYFATTDVNEN